MNLDDLKALVRKGESDRVEFKRSTGQRTAAARTVCAMLNGLGGFVIFGVRDKGQVVGQQVSATTIEELANELRRIEPPVFPDIETIPLKDNRAVIVVSVPGGGGPHTFDGRPYVRNGPTTIRMPREEYDRKLLDHRQCLLPRRRHRALGVWHPEHHRLVRRKRKPPAHLAGAGGIGLRDFSALFLAGTPSWH